jgi:hypothetical protein
VSHGTHLPNNAAECVWHASNHGRTVDWDDTPLCEALTSLRSSRKWQPMLSMWGTGVRSRITYSTWSMPLAHANLETARGTTAQGRQDRW